MALKAPQGRVWRSATEHGQCPTREYASKEPRSSLGEAGDVIVFTAVILLNENARWITPKVRPVRPEMLYQLTSSLKYLLLLPFFPTPPPPSTLGSVGSFV